MFYFLNKFFRKTKIGNDQEHPKKLRIAIYSFFKEYSIAINFGSLKKAAESAFFSIK
jgi:hypothetical protein